MYSSDDDFSDDDYLSVRSVCSSDNGSLSMQLADIDESNICNVVLDKIEAEIEKLLIKRSETRIKALDNLTLCFRKAYLDIDSTDWKYNETFSHGLEYSIQNGSGHDRVSALKLLSVVCTQFPSDDVEKWFDYFKPKLDKLLNDSAIPIAVRSACASALGSLTWFSQSTDYAGIKVSLNILESVFKSACLKGDGKSPKLEPNVMDLHEKCMTNWLLMVLQLPYYDIKELGKHLISTLISMLKTTNVPIRIVAGELLAVIYEQIRMEEETFKGPQYKELKELLLSLSTDNSKNTSKNDRKKQRISMRLATDSVLNQLPPKLRIKFGRESMTLYTATSHFYYDCICELLTVGMNRHLKDNTIVRCIFELGDPLPKETDSVANRKESKAQRNYANQYASKSRTQYLQSHRKKKSNFQAMFDEN